MFISRRRINFCLSLLLLFLLTLIPITGWTYGNGSVENGTEDWQLQGFSSALEDKNYYVWIKAFEQASLFQFNDFNLSEYLTGNREENARSFLQNSVGKTTVERLWPTVARVLYAADLPVQSYIPKLIESLQRSRSWDYIAAEALGQVPEATAKYIPQLVELLENSPRKGQLANVLGSVGVFLGEEAPRVIDTFRDPDFADPSHRASLEAVVALVKMGAATTADAYRLLPFIEESNDSIRNTAAKTLGKMGELAAPLVPQLITLLQSTDVSTQSGAALALGRLGKVAEGQVDDIIQVLQNSNPAVREVASRALKFMGEAAKESVPQLSKFLDDSDPTLRRAAVLALGGMGESAKGQIPQMIQLLDDPELAVRNAAVDAFEEMGEAVGEYAPLIAQRLPKPSAFAILGAMGESARAHVPDIVQFLTHPDPDIRQDAIEALAGRGVSEGLGVVVSEQASVVAQLLDDPRIEIRRAAAEILGDIGEAAQKHVPQLAQKFKDTDLNVRRLAAVALAQIGEPAKDYAPQIVAQLGAPHSALENLGPLDRHSVLPLLNMSYITEQPQYEYFPFNTLVSSRFYAYYLCSTDPGALTLIRWLGKPQAYPELPDRPEGREILATFADAWEDSQDLAARAQEPYQDLSNLRKDLAAQIVRIAKHVDWQIDDLALLRTHYNNLEEDGFESEAQELQETIREFSWWRRTWHSLQQFWNLAEATRRAPHKAYA